MLVNKWNVWSKPLSEDVCWQRIEFSLVTTFNGESDSVASLTCVWVVVDHTVPTPPHNKDLALIFGSVSLPHQDFIFCQKHLEQAFCYVNFFTHISINYINKQAVRLGGRHLCPRPTLTFDLEVGVGVACDLGYPCAKFRLPSLLGLLVFELEPMYATSDGRQTPMTA